MTSLLTIAAASAGAAVGVWLSTASLHLVAGEATGPDRVAVFAPFSTLIVLLLAAAAFAAALWFGGERTSRARAVRAWTVAPMAALWLWTVPYLPWVADRFPLVRLLAGPLRWLVAALAIGAVLHRTFRASGWSGAFVLPGRRMAFVVSLALFVWLGARSFSTIGIAGDEPHYLIISQSLLADGDLKIENNHAQREYRRFFAGTLRLDFRQRGVDGEVYSIHAPGMSALVLPAYAAAGPRGAIWMVALLGALAALAIFDLAARIGGRSTAWFTWAAVCLTVPFLPHAWSIYPEAGAVAIAAWVALWLASPAPSTPGLWAMRGACLALLPWLHTKMVVLLAAFAALFFWKLRSRIGSLLAILAPIVISGAAWLAFFYLIYGTLNPQAPYGASAGELGLANVPRSLLGLLIDQKFGLLIYAPIYAFAAVGSWLMIRDPEWRWPACAWLSVAAVFAVSSGRLFMWWGGSSAPARFLVPALPLLAPMIAFTFHRTRGLMKALLVAGAVVSVAISVRGLIDMNDRLLFSDARAAGGRMVEAIQGTAPLAQLLPTFTQDDVAGPLRQLFPWLAALAGVVAAGRLMSRRVSPVLAVAVQTVLFMVLATAFAGPMVADVGAAAVAQSSAALLGRFDPAHARAFHYRTWSALAPAAWLHAGRVQTSLDAQLPLPPGRYQARVWFNGDYQRAGDLRLMIRRTQALATLAGPLPNPATLSFDLPLPLPAAWLQLTDNAAASTVVRAEFEPVALVPVSERPPFTAIAAETIASRPHAYMVYVDDATYPEGGVFWTRGTARGGVLVAVAGARQLTLTVRTGAAAGPVRITVDGAHHQQDMEAGETRELAFDIPDGAAWVRLTAQAARSFRPADVDDQSADMRELGCQVRVGLL